MGIGFRTAKILRDFFSQCEIWHVWIGITVCKKKKKKRKEKTGRVDPAEMTQGRDDSQAEMEIGRADPLLLSICSPEK